MEEEKISAATTQVNSNSEQNKQEEITEQTVTDIIELLKDQKQEVKNGTMFILLKCSNNPSQRKLFESTEVIKLMLRFMQEPPFETTALSNLINFSQDTVYQKQIIEFNGIQRIVETIKEIISNIIKNKQTTIEKKQKLQIELSSLILINVTEGEYGAQQFMQTDQKELQGHYFQILLELYNNPQYMQLLRFVPNILVNGSQIEEGRKIMIQSEHQIIQKTIPKIFDPDRNTRVCILKMLRNCIFEYENEEFNQQIFLKQNYFLDSLTMYILHVLFSSYFLELKEKQQALCIQLLGIFGINENSLRFKLTKVSKEKEIEEIEIATDILLVLSNVDLNAKQPVFNEQALLSTITILTELSYPSEDIQNKFDVISVTYQLKHD